MFTPPPQIPRRHPPGPSAPPPPLCWENPLLGFSTETDPSHTLSGASEPLPLPRAEKAEDIRNVHQEN